MLKISVVANNQHNVGVAQAKFYAICVLETQRESPKP